MALQVNKDIIIKYIYKHCLSHSEFCEISGINRYTLRRILNDKPISNMEYLKKLAKFFDISVLTLTQQTEKVNIVEIEKNVFCKLQK